MNEQQIPGQDPSAVPAKTTNVNVYEQPAATTASPASSGVNIQTIVIIAAVVVAVILLINMIS